MTSEEQIKIIAQNLSKHSRVSYMDVYKYLLQAVVVYQVELPEPDTIDYTSDGALGNFLKWVEQQKHDKITVHAPSCYTLYRRPDAPLPVLSQPSSPKAYGQMLQRKRHK